LAAARAAGKLRQGVGAAWLQQVCQATKQEDSMAAEGHMVACKAEGHMVACKAEGHMAACKAEGHMAACMAEDRKACRLLLR
jgi:hypothetical protein